MAEAEPGGIDRAEKFAHELASGKSQSIKAAMLNAGYPEKRARKGIRGVSKKQLEACKKEGIELVKLAKQFTPQERADIAVGRLIQNCMDGKDGGVMSAKTLGSHRDLNLWTPEQMAGLIVINAPAKLLENKEDILNAEH